MGPSPSAEAFVKLVSPAENAEIVARKPTIKAIFIKEVVPESVLINVDGTDYSQLASKTPQGFEVTPPLPLAPGPHQVTVTAQDRSGQSLSYTAVFSSKHTNTFDEVTSSNSLTATYEVAVHKPSSQDNAVSDWLVDANLASSSRLRKGPWRVSLDGVARYKDQDLAIPPPERRGADIVSYTFKGGYEKGQVKAEAAVGDVLVDETPYTLTALGRRGATISGDVGFLAVDAFSVQSQSVYGTRHGLSLGGGLDEHIRGGSGTIRLFANRLALKSVYVDGGELPNSFNIGTILGPRRGNVLGFRLTSDFFTGKLRTDFEADFSDFTPDNTATTREAKEDRAFRFSAAGASGTFAYEGVFEYVGRDYEVVGNPGLARNRMGARLQGSTTFANQTVTADVSRYEDNVKDDSLFPVNVNWQAGLQYALSRWTSFPVSVAYRYNRQESTDVPAGQIKPLDQATHDVSGNAAYVAGIWSAALSGGTTRTDDKSVANADIRAWNVRFAPGLNWPTVSVTPSGAYNETKAGAVRTEVTTWGLDGRAQFLAARLTAELGSTWAFTKASDRSQDNRNLTGSFRVGYNFADMLSVFFRPSVAFRGTYVRVDDDIMPAADRDEWTLFLSIAAEVPIVI